MVRRFKLRNQRRNVVLERFRRPTLVRRLYRKFAVLTALGSWLGWGPRLWARGRFALGWRGGARAAT